MLFFESVWLWGLVGIAIAYVLLYLAIYRFQPRLIFLPTRKMRATPDQQGLTYEDVWLTIPKGDKVESVHGWWIPSFNPNGKVLLYFHGKTLNISGHLRYAQNFHNLGFSLFLVDYRGYGRSEGNFPNEIQVYEDAELAWNYLVQQRGIKPENIFFYGHSLGGAIALDLAVRNPQIAGLIMESSFSGIYDMARHQLVYRIYPLKKLVHQLFDSLNKIKSLKVPILIIHGTKDELVPVWMGKALFEAAPEPKKLLLIPGGYHNNILGFAPEEYNQAIREFYDSAISLQKLKVGAME